MAPPHKGHAAVVGEQLLDPDAPLGPGHQVSVGLLRLAQVADPRVQVLQGVKGGRSHQDVQTVPAVGPESQSRAAEGWRRSSRILEPGTWSRSSPAAAVVPTQDDFHPVAADGAVGLVTVVVVAEQRLGEVVLWEEEEEEGLGTHRASRRCSTYFTLQAEASSKQRVEDLHILSPTAQTEACRHNRR